MHRLITRRELLSAAAATVIAPASVWSQSPTRLFAFVGSWTEQPNGAGGNGGLHVLRVNDDGSLTLIQDLTSQINAGYLCISPDSRFLYCTDERKNREQHNGAGGSVLAWSIDPQSARLQPLNSAPSMGTYPAFIAIDPAGRYIAVANHGSYDPVTRIIDGKLQTEYDDATVALFTRASDGSIEPASDVAIIERGPAENWSTMTGLASVFQASPHAHSVNFDPSGRFALACDKGTNRIYVYRIVAGRLVEASVFTTPAASGPRHAAFHPSGAYVVVLDELIPNVTSYAFDRANGTLRRISNATTVEHPDATQQWLPSDVHFHPTGRFVYTSTRGANKLALFAFDDHSGHLTPVKYTESGGTTPRAFNIDPAGRYLFSCGQDSNNIATFRIDTSTGKLTPTVANFTVPRPVCIKFAYL